MYFYDRIRERLLIELDKSKREKGCYFCCCLCCRLMNRELTSNNQIYNFITVSSLLTFRVLRLMLLFLAIILEFSFCALFFDLNSSDESDPSFFWDGFLSDFWVAVYTSLFTLLPMLLLALSFRPSSKLKALL